MPAKQKVVQQAILEALLNKTCFIRKSNFPDILAVSPDLTGQLVG
jgi:hypothetical protein